MTVTPTNATIHVYDPSNEARSTITKPPSRLARIAASAIIGAVFSGLTWNYLTTHGPQLQAADFTYPWFAARAMLNGENPYTAIRSTPMPFTRVLFYPLPAAIVAMPVAWLSARTAGVVLVGLGCALLAFAVTRKAWWPLVMFLSAPARQVYWSVQWAPLMMAVAILWPALGLTVVKTNLVLPLTAFQTTWRAVWIGAAGGTLLVIASLLWQPSWPHYWIAALRHDPLAGQYRIPILSPWGAVIGLAALKWRRPEARLLLCMACAPQNVYFYDQFPLLLVPNNFRQMLIAAVISQAAHLAPWWISVVAPNVSWGKDGLMPIVIVGLYLPALMMVLRRPNEGDASRWIERATIRLPLWLRGRSTPRSA